MAWQTESHPLLTQRSLAAVAHRYQLTTPVVVTPFEPFLAKLAPHLQIPPTELALALWMGTDPAVSLGTSAAGEHIGQRVAPLAILAAYSAAPDDGRDKNLYRRGPNGAVLLDAAQRPIPLYNDLFWMGGPQKQAWRHMEKPPLRLSALGATMGYPFGTLGMASAQAQRYFYLAGLAQQIGEPYWAWRWLGCALHYVQDLTQPHHTTQINSHGKYLWRAIELWLATDVTLPKAVTMLIGNSHHWYESYVTMHLHMARIGTPVDARAEELLLALGGDSTAALPTGDGQAIQQYARELRDTTNRRAPDLLAAIYDMSALSLISLHEYQETEPAELYLREARDSRFLLAEQRFFALTHAQLTLAGEATRTLVAALVAHRAE